jgi:hypothetical protein
MTFETFWASYPHPDGRRTGRKTALARHLRLSGPERGELGIAMGVYREHLIRHEWKTAMLATTFIGRSDKGFRAWLPDQDDRGEVLDINDGVAGPCEHTCRGCGGEHVWTCGETVGSGRYCGIPEVSVCQEYTARVRERAGQPLSGRKS